MRLWKLSWKTNQNPCFPCCMCDLLPVIALMKLISITKMLLKFYSKTFRYWTIYIVLAFIKGEGINSFKVFVIKMNQKSSENEAYVILVTKEKAFEWMKN